MDEQLKEHDIELSLITLHWFLTAFASVVHTKVGWQQKVKNYSRIIIFIDAVMCAYKTDKGRCTIMYNVQGS